MSVSEFMTSLGYKYDEFGNYIMDYYNPDDTEKLKTGIDKYYTEKLNQT